MEHHVRVAIVDDHPVVEGVLSWIRADPGQRITVTQVVADVTGLDGPDAADVLILDLELGGRMIADEVARLAASGYRIVAFLRTFTRPSSWMSWTPACACLREQRRGA